MNIDKSAICAAGLAVALSAAVTGCRSTASGKPAVKPGKLTIFSERDIIPAPYKTPQAARLQTKPATPPMPLVDIDTPPQPGIPGSADPVFIPQKDTGTPEQPMPNIDIATPESPVYIPETPEQKPYTPPAPKRTYKVQKGDSLSIIAQMYKISWPALAAENNLTEKSILKIGQELVLPAGAAETPGPRPSIKPRKTGTTAPAVVTGLVKDNTAPKTAPQTMPADGLYTVQKGDSLWTISRKFGVKESEIKALNSNITDMGRLQIGQRLRLKAATPAVESPIKAQDDVPLPGEVPPAMLPAVPETAIPVPPTQNEEPQPAANLPAEPAPLLPPAPLPPPMLPQPVQPEQPPMQ